MKLRFLKNVSFGALCGLLLGIGFMAYLDSDLSENRLKYGTYLLALLGSMAASAAALFGVLASIENGRSLEEEKRAKDLLASKAVLPLVLNRLSELTDFAIETCAKPDIVANPSKGEAISKEISLSEDMISILRDCIRNADNETGQWLSHLISHYQVYRSRTMELVMDVDLITTEHDQAERVADWILLKALTSHLYGFARGADEPPTNLDRHLLVVPIMSRIFATPLHKLTAKRLERIEKHYSPMGAADFLLLEK